MMIYNLLINKKSCFCTEKVKRTKTIQRLGAANNS